MRAGTTDGAHALKIDTGAIEAGKRADLVSIDLEHTTLAGWTDANLAALLALSAPASVVRDVWVGGQRRVENRQHEQLRSARARFDAVCRRILA
jgi:formimidoylglutamate deiminase